MDQVRRIEEALDDFKDTLPLYREQLESWYSRAADRASQAADLPSLMEIGRAHV